MEAIFDYRENLSIGSKMKDCKILGTPYMIILGDKTQGDKVELEEIKTGEKTIVTIEELIEKLK